MIDEGMDPGGMDLGMEGDPGLGMEGEEQFPLEGEEEMFEGGDQESDPLPITLSKEDAQELLDLGEVEIVVPLEDEFVEVRLVIDDGDFDPLDDEDEDDEFDDEDLQLADPEGMGDGGELGGGPLGLDEGGPL